MHTILRSTILPALLFIAATPATADVTISGDYLKFGVGTNGSLIDFDGYTGLQFDPTGKGKFNEVGDILSAGSPFAFFSLGVNGAVAWAGGGIPNNPFGSSTSAVVGADSAALVTSGGSYNGLQILQTITFNLHSRVISTAVVLTNVSGAELNDVAYGVGFDPDQDSDLHGTANTVNTILGQGSQAGVEAYGPGSRYAIRLSNSSGWANTTAQITLPWELDPYVLSGPSINAGNDDASINLGYAFGTLGVGEQVTFAYQVTVSAVPEPPTYAMLLGGLALLGWAARRRRGM